MTLEPGEILHRLAIWSEGQPCVREVHAFGSRIRGDARSDSDLDILIDLDVGDRVAEEALSAWVREQQNFPDMRGAFPECRLHILVLQWTEGALKEPVVAEVLRARRHPLLTLGRAHALLTRQAR